ncbi:MAG TPA: hypothetical protein VMS64_09905 [Candidatus Methylomirabilis sp.]|nr:hypothetical protein [Candidatus Methylomirabilis sp.]
MSTRRETDERGSTLLELLVAATIGVVVLLGMLSLYLATSTAFDESTSQVALQREGALALQVIMHQGVRASAVAFNTCGPAGSNSRSLQLTVTDTTPPSLPASQLGTYCYYAGNGSNGAPAGALCQSFTPAGGKTGPCWNLLGAPQPGLIQRAGAAAGVTLIQQTSPANPLCPRNPTDTSGSPVAGGQAIASGVHCLALARSTGPGGQATADIAFAITDGLNGMTFTASLMLRN